MHQEIFFAEQASFLENAPISHQLKLGGLLMTPPKLEVFWKKMPRWNPWFLPPLKKGLYDWEPIGAENHSHHQFGPPQKRPEMTRSLEVEDHHFFSSKNFQIMNLCRALQECFVGDCFFFYHFFWASRIARNLEWQTICFTCFLLITLRDCRLVPSTFSDTSGPQMVPTYWWKTQGLAALICSGPNVQPSFYHGKSPFFKTIRRIFLIFSKSPMVFGAWSRCQIPAAMRLPFVAFGPPWPSVWAWRVPPATATAWRCCGGRPGPKAASARWPWRSASWRIAWWRFIVIGMEIWGKWRLDLFICYRYLWNMNCNWFCNLNSYCQRVKVHFNGIFSCIMLLLNSPVCYVLKGQCSITNFIVRKGHGHWVVLVAFLPAIIQLNGASLPQNC